MARLDSLSPVRGGPLVELRLEGGDRLRVHQRRATGLAAGGLLNPVQLDELRRAVHVDRCEQRALRLLAVRARSAAELHRRLTVWGLGAAEAEDVVLRLADLTLVDDAALARDHSRHLRARGHGRLRARADLKRMQIDDEAGEEVIRGHAEGDLEAARAIVAARFGSLPLASGEIRRAGGLLVRRGFDEEIVRAALGMDEAT